MIKKILIVTGSIFLLIISLYVSFNANMLLIWKLASDSFDYNRVLPCHPKAHRYGGIDGGYFLEITQSKPPYYYIMAFNDGGYLLFKGEFKYNKGKLNEDNIDSIVNNFDNDHRELNYLTLKDGTIIEVKSKQEKEFLLK
jgi:hypothetical protein